MCRYAIYGPYKPHYACFACRKAFKQPIIADWLATRDRGYFYKELSRVRFNSLALAQREVELGVRLDDLVLEYQAFARRCPECSGTMVDMGLDFKAPRHSDVDAWRILQGMYVVGHQFHTCGCDGPGYIPRSPSDYRQYLDRVKKAYIAELETTRSSAQLDSASRHEAAAYWQSRISRLDAELIEAA